MNRVKKMMTGVLTLALCVSIIPGTGVKAEDADTQTGRTSSAPVPANLPVSVGTPDNVALTYQAGQQQDFVLIVKNTGSQPLTGLTLSADLGDESKGWPFKTDYQSYSENIGTLEAGKEASVTFQFTQREDAPTDRYRLKFVIGADSYEPYNHYVYVNTTAKAEDKKENNNTGNTNSGNGTGNSDGGQQSGADMGEFAAMGADAGGYSNGGAVYSGGGDSGSASVPRVIVTGFNTDPAEVRAGSNFTLTIHLKNTSKSTRVGNMLFDLSAPTEGKDEQTTAPAFLPASGANSIYLDGIAADSAADISIQLNAKSDLLQKPYSIGLNMKYEDGNAAQIESSSSISIPVKQDARFEFSEFEISPQSVAVGEEANVMCNLYNMGRIKLYNVKATFEGNSIKKEELFLGNVESGATGAIDAMLEGKSPSGGPAKVTMTLSYEDEAGNISKAQKDLELEVVEETADDAAAAMMPEQQAKAFPVIPVAGGAVLLAVIAAAAVIIRKKKKRLMSEEEEGLLDELDGSAEDEQ